MAILTANFTTNQASTELVPAAPDKLIRVLRILASFESSGTLKLISAPGQPEAADLTSLVYLGAGGLLHLHLGREQALTAARGKALGLSTSISAASKGQGIMVWYELVD